MSVTAKLTHFLEGLVGVYAIANAKPLLGRLQLALGGGRSWGNTPQQV